MPPSAAVITRNQGTGLPAALAGYRAGATINELGVAEAEEPATANDLCGRSRDTRFRARRIVAMATVSQGRRAQS